MATSKMTADEKRWRAKSDANILVQYQEIMSNKERKKAATNALGQELKETTERAKAIKYAIGGKLKK